MEPANQQPAPVIITVPERIRQLESLINVRGKMIDAIESEGGFEEFKIATWELRGELRALANLKIEDQRTDVPVAQPEEKER